MTLVQEDDNELFLVTQSEMGCWRRCKRKWWLSYYRKLRLKPQYQKPNALSQGISFHDLMDVHYQGGDWREIVVEQERRIKELETEGTIDAAKAKKYLGQIELAAIMVEGYEEWIEESGEDAGLEIIGSEVRMEAPLAVVEGVQVNALGKYDLLVKRHGLLGFMDHKSAQTIDAWKIRLMNREQFRWYAALLSLLGSEEAPTKAWLNVAKKVKRTARATPPFYERLEVPINGYQIANVQIRAKAMSGEMIRAHRALDNGVSHHEIAYPNPTGNCSWDCEFSQVCPMFDDGSRVEAFLSDWYDQASPLERYERDVEEERDAE